MYKAKYKKLQKYVLLSIQINKRIKSNFNFEVCIIKNISDSLPYGLQKQIIISQTMNQPSPTSKPTNSSPSSSSAAPKVTITNLKDLPIYTPLSERLVENIKQSTNLNDIQQNIQNWINYLNHQSYNVEEMVVKVQTSPSEKVKSPTPSSSSSASQSLQQPAYYLQLMPKYDRYTLSYRTTIKSIDVLAMAVCKSDLIKRVGAMSVWNYRNKYLKNQLFIQGHYPWRASFHFNKGKPLTKLWVTDMKKFAFSWTLEPWDKYSLNENSSVSEKKTEQKIIFQMKGYTNRLSKKMLNQRKAYIDPKFSKVLDLFQISYSIKKDFNNHNTIAGLNICSGTDFSQSRYIKIKPYFAHNFPLSDRYNLQINGKGGTIFGKNVPIQQYPSRNSLHWMNQRSKWYFTLQAMLDFRQLRYLSSLNIVPGNYLQFWVSRNPQNKIKVEAEAGISLKLRNNLCACFGLFRVSGVKGEPSFGLKYQF